MINSASQAECRGFNSPFSLKDNSLAHKELGSFFYIGVCRKSAAFYGFVYGLYWFTGNRTKRHAELRWILYYILPSTPCSEVA